MGLLVDGHWQDRWYDTDASGGRFVRKESSFRHKITPAGQFTAAPGRYHLYVSLACPWAHRTLILRSLKGLEDAISISVVDWLMREDGWTFAENPGTISDTVNGAKFLHEVYVKVDPHYTGRVTVPMLWDKQTNAIVNNESSEIIRIFNTAFDGIGARPDDYFPEHLHAEIEALNSRIYNTLNNGVYKAGFATTQQAYEEAIAPLFETLDWLEARLAGSRYLIGSDFTEADIRLFTTLIRFDAVYVGHFKCNLRRIADYPHLSAYTRDIYQHPGIAGTVNFQHIKNHYYQSHATINPTGIVPAGPIQDFTTPHGREGLGS
jgi:putative glutathione S-transferase